MVEEPRSPQSGRDQGRSASTIDPHGYLRPGLRVLGEQGKTIGTIAVVERTPADEVMALKVQHGLIRRQHTRIQLDQVKQVNQDSVVLSLTRARFRELPEMTKGESGSR